MFNLIAFMCVLILLIAVSGHPIMSTTYETHERASVIEVGQGNLKLVFDEGKMSHYLNSRNSVRFSQFECSTLVFLMNKSLFLCLPN